MPSTSSDPLAPKASVPRSQLRDGDAQERHRMWAMGLPYPPASEPESRALYPHRTPEGILKWLRENPEIRTDSPAFPINPGEDPERRHWIFEDSIAYTVLRNPSAWKTPGLLEEVLRRIPDFDRKDKSGRTLLEALKRKKPARTQIISEMERRVAEKEAIDTLPVLNEVAEKINLPEDIQAKIAEYLTGKTGPVARQEAELRKDIGGRRTKKKIHCKRKTVRRAKQSKSRKRGAQR
jgi:hypothetical protein